MSYEIEKKNHGVAEKPNIWTQDLPIVTTIHPPLAKEIGLNESIVLRQIAFWLNTSNNFRDGEWWTYQSLEDMKKKAFPYWSVATISRVINNLCDAGLIKKSDVYNKRKNDRTQWFALNIEGLNKLTSIKVIFQNAKWILQDEKTILQDETTLPEYIQQNIDHKENTNALDAQADEPIENAALQEMVTLVKRELKQYGKTSIKIAKLLLGLHTGKSAELNLVTPITVEMFMEFVADWDKRKDRSGNKLIRPKNIDSVKSNFETWLETRNTTNPVQAPKTLSQRKAPANLDMLATEKDLS